MNRKVSLDSPSGLIIFESVNTFLGALVLYFYLFWTAFKLLKKWNRGFSSFLQNVNLSKSTGNTT